MSSLLELQQFISRVMKHSETWTRDYVSFSLSERDCRHETTESHHFNGEITNWGLIIMYEDNDGSKSEKICEWLGFLGVLITNYLIANKVTHRYITPGLRAHMGNTGVHITIYLPKSE